MKIAKPAKLFIAHAYTALCVALCLFLGKALYSLVGGLPGPIYGMLLFTLMLRLGVISEPRIGPCANIYVKYMPLIYVPAVLGVMNYSELLFDVGWKILLVGVFTTLSGITLAGLLAQKIFQAEKSEAQKEQSKCS